MNKMMIAKQLRAMAEEIESKNFFQKLKEAFPVKEGEWVTGFTLFYDDIAFATSQEAKKFLFKWAKTLAAMYNWKGEKYELKEGDDGYLSSTFFTDPKNQAIFADQNHGYYPINTREWQLSDQYVGIITGSDGEIYFYSFSTPEEFCAKMEESFVDEEALQKIGKVVPEMVPEEYR